MTALPTWAFVVATHERPEILRQALTLAADQRPAPLEIIVTDSSRDPEPVRAVMASLALGDPAIRWCLLRADAPSLPTQRGQGAAASNADVLVMFDDDSMMRPGCAAALLATYDADADRRVLGVEATEAHGRPPLGSLKRFVVQRLLMADPVTHFIPYDASFPALPIPTAVTALGAQRRRVMEGFLMTLRREAFDLEHPEGLLPGSAHMEDYDLSYRVSRHGALVSCPNAMVDHLAAPAGRSTHEEIVARSLLNQALLLRRHAVEHRRAGRAYRRKALLRAMTGLVKNGWFGRPRGATWRGVRVGMPAGQRVLACADDRVEATYLRERDALLATFADR